MGQGKYNISSNRVKAPANKLNAAKLTKRELIKKLAELSVATDTEHAHWEADDLLLGYIGDPDIRAAYERINKWYA